MHNKLKHLLVTILVVFLLINALIAIHSYKLTHFDEDTPPIAANYNISFFEKIKVALFGINIPKPKSNIHTKYTEIEIPAGENKYLSAWHLKTDSTRKGLVLMFHGFIDEKSSMIPKANEILAMGYDAILVDFMGSGNSYGNQTTIGYLEAANVVAAYNFILPQMEEKEKLFLQGFSMGAVAIMKAQHDEQMNVDGIILEAPYSTLETTIESRASLLNIPQQPLSFLFTFWIGAVNGFNAFDAQPIRFAETINTPTLLMCGDKDQYISVDETQDIFDAIGTSQKELHYYENSTHESYLLKHRNEWKQAVNDFLADHS